MADHGLDHEGRGVIKLKVTVTLEDGTTFPQVKVMPGDVVRFERHFKVRIGSIGEDTQLEHLLYLGWSPLHRRGLTGLEFDDFCDQVENVDLSTDGDASPTSPAPSEDDSSS